MSVPADPIVRGRLIWLRPFEPADAPLYARWRSDEEAVRTAGWGAPGPISEAEAERLIGRWAGGGPDQEQFHFVICLLTDGRPIGQVILTHHDRRRRAADFGIFIADPADRGQGYGTDALNAVADFGFGELMLERLALVTLVNNEAAIRSYEKAGLQREGLHHHGDILDGEWVDTLEMALIREDWLALPRPKSWEL